MKGGGHVDGYLQMQPGVLLRLMGFVTPTLKSTVIVHGGPVCHRSANVAARAVRTIGGGSNIVGELC